MRLHSVKLNNFKSFDSSSYSEVIIEPSVTVVIGKNESGKSNVIEGISQISFYQKKNAAFSEEILNRNCEDGGSISYEVILESSTEEINTYNISAKSQAILTATACCISGGFFELFSIICGESFSQFIEYASDHSLQSKNTDELSAFKRNITELQISESINTWAVEKALNYFKNIINKFQPEVRQEYEKRLKSMNDNFNRVMQALPTIFCRNDKKTLAREYKLNDTQKELAQTNAAEISMLYSLLKVIGISHEDFIEAMKSGMTGKRTSLRTKINQSISEKINDPFHAFYDVEKINLSVEFDSNIAKFSVSAENGTQMLLSERSDGLKWYLNTFIDARAQEQSMSHVVYLFDEPGTSLHVNAQRKLLELFSELADSSKENQVIYTTHSPYMLDTTEIGIERIRAVVKDESEISKIYKTPYDSKISPDYQEDTLTPMMMALGMNLTDTFGPANNKFNVVTEGTSDVVFLTSIAKKIGIDLSKYAFIPVVGASNCVSICLILHGWGCKFTALFDYDTGGVESGQKLTNIYDFEYGKHYLYVKECTQEDIKAKKYKSEPSSIEDLVPDLQQSLEDSNHQKIEGKPLRAKCYENAMMDGTHDCSSETIENFKKLFERIELCAKAQENERKQ